MPQKISSKIYFIQFNSFQFYLYMIDVVDFCGERVYYQFVVFHLQSLLATG